MKKLVVLTGAGVSAESGIATFRDADGLWMNHKMEDVASIQGWRKNRELVLNFYNTRRKDAANTKPNEGHKGLVKLEEDYDVTIITQNVDTLHEQAGSTKVIHLHGQLDKMRSCLNPNVLYDYEDDIKVGDKAGDGSQLRPHIVWFGEDVPMMGKAWNIVAAADVFVVVGTSLQVYPAASLITAVPDDVAKYIIDPTPAPLTRIPNLTKIEKVASEGVAELIGLLYMLRQN